MVVRDPHARARDPWARHIHSTRHDIHVSRALPVWASSLQPHSSLLPGSKHSLSAQRDAGSWVWQEQAGGPDGQGWGDVDVVTWTVVAWML